MQVQLRQAGTPTPEVIGVEAASIRNGHSYRIVVSSLISRRQLGLGAWAAVRKREDERGVGKEDEDAGGRACGAAGLLGKALGRGRVDVEGDAAQGGHDIDVAAATDDRDREARDQVVDLQQRNAQS